MQTSTCFVINKIYLLIFGDHTSKVLNQSLRGSTPCILQKHEVKILQNNNKMLWIQAGLTLFDLILFKALPQSEGTVSINCSIDGPTLDSNPL